MLTTAGLSAWALAGCGDDDDDNGKSTPATSGAASATKSTSGSASPAAEQRKQGGAITFVNAGEPANLDVHKSGSTYSAASGFGIAYGLLVKPKMLGTGGKLVAEGELAQKWEQPDKTTYIFSLYPNAKYHNIAPVNGRQVTADDVVFSFKRQIAEKVNASALGTIKSMTAVDKQTVKFELESPDAEWLGALTSYFNRVVPPETVEIKGDLTAGPVIGSGPFIFKEWQKGVAQRFVRNPDYHIPTYPGVDTLTFPYLTDPANWEAQFLAGQVSSVQGALIGVGIPLKRILELDKNKYATFRATPYSTLFTWVETTQPPFNDVRVRKALLMAVDRGLINSNVFEGEAQPDAIGMTGDRGLLLTPQEADKLWPFDPKAAKQMLEAAGGAPKQVIPAYQSAATTSTAQIVQSNWKAIGFETDIKVIDAVELTTKVNAAANTQYRVAVTPVLHAATLSADLETFYKTGGGRNGGHLSNPQVDALIAQQKQEFDEAKRKDLLAQLQRLIVDQAYILPMGQLAQIYAWPKAIRGLEAPLVSPYQFADLWWSA